MTNPPNYRRVECCGNCRYGSEFGDFSTICEKIEELDASFVKASYVCDDYEAEDGE